MQPHTITSSYGMPSRGRESAATPGSQGRLPVLSTKPVYESLGYPLKQDGINALERIQRQSLTGNLKYLDEHLKSAIELLTECAEDINELVAEQQEDGKRGYSASQEPDEGEPQNLEERVDNLTRRMDEHVRKTIDNGQDVSDIKGSLVKIIAESRQSISNPGLSQPSQMNSNENGEVENSQIESSLLVNAESAPSISFNKHITTARDEYQTQSARIRYSEHNDYKAFKATVFEAQHGPEAEMPHPSTWFDNDNVSPGAGTASADKGAQSDDDLQTIRVRINTKCPLSLTEMINPTSNKSCTHVFEKTAIESYIKAVDPTRRNPKNTKICPVPGCEKRIRLDELVVDGVLVRKIQRIQKARERAQTQAMDSNEEISGEDDWGRVDGGEDAIDED